MAISPGIIAFWASRRMAIRPNNTRIEYLSRRIFRVFRGKNILFRAVNFSPSPSVTPVSTVPQTHKKGFL
jgi:hypothetical protein